MLDLDPRQTALFLDFDGTLVDIVERPDAVVVPPSLPPLLGRLRDRFGGAVAVVSGRPVEELDRWLAPERLPVAGLHGMEWRVDDGVERLRPLPALDEIRDQIDASGLAARGMRVEDKGLSIALHYREAPDLRDRVISLANAATRPFPELTLLDGKMVVEIKPRAASKASAVRRFMDVEPFAGRVPVFVGDDVTDEDGMSAAIAAGGSAVKVGEGNSVAENRLQSPADVHRWLADVVGG